MKAKSIYYKIMENKEFEKRFLELYETGISTTDICKCLGVSRDKGYKFLKKKGLPSNPRTSKIYTEEVIEMLSKEYCEGATIEELQKKYPEYSGNLNGHLKKRGVTRRRGKISNCNPRYFSSIDEPEKAYLLGLLMADGSVTKSNHNNYALRIELQAQDKYLLEFLAKSIGSTLQVKESYGNGNTYVVNGKQYTNHKHNCYFSVSNIDLINDLIALGCIPNKSKILDDLPAIPANLYKDFILGYYDGDGIASVGKRHYMGFVGTKKFLSNIADKIYMDTGVPAPNVTYNRFNDMYYLCYNSNQAQITLFHYFYDNTTYTHLKRKEDKMKEVLFK